MSGNTVRKKFQGEMSQVFIDSLYFMIFSAN